MCGDTGRDGRTMRIEGNSIHHTFSRCTTVHGSHNVFVSAVHHFFHGKQALKKGKRENENGARVFGCFLIPRHKLDRTLDTGQKQKQFFF